MLDLITCIVMILFFSAICSGSEAALFSMPLSKALLLAQSKSSSALALLKIRKNMQRPIATIVILNSITNIGGSILAAALTTNALGSKWLGLVSGILTFLVIVVSEIIPKTIGEKYSQKISVAIARPLLWISRLFTPIVWCIEKITAPFTKGGNTFTTNESEIKLLATIGQQQGVIEKKEAEFIHRVFELNDLTAKDLMTPRVMMTFLEGNTTLKEAQEFILNSQHSRIAVAKDTKDNITGIVYKDELLSAIIQKKDSQLISSFVHSARFVPENVSADRLLSFFQQDHKHLAVVISEYGNVSGVVTLEDVLEILTGDIVDETDKITNLRRFARKQKRPQDK
ncbi:hemolysin family protein [bacterium]|nr:hemolysin family protein [bacterium]